MVWGVFVEQFLNAEEQSVLCGYPNKKTKASVMEQLLMKGKHTFICLCVARIKTELRFGSTSDF